MAFPQGTAVQDWIQDYYSPVLCVLASDDAEAVAFKNNLSVTELLQPFSKVLAAADLGISDADGARTYPNSINIILQDFKKDLNRLITQKVMLDRVSQENCRESELVTHNFDKLSIDIPGATPWFDVWMKHYLHSLPVSEYEFLKHVFGCIFVVSSSCNTSPVEKLRGLVEMQHRNQHEQKSINYFSPNIIKCFILLHDASNPSVDETEAQTQFSQMQSAFGPQVCHYLKINTGDIINNDSSDVNNSVKKSYLSQYWLGFSHRFFSSELRRNISDASPTGGAADFNFQSPTADSLSPTGGGSSKPPTALEHPLALAEAPESPAIVIPNTSRLSRASPDTVAAALSDTDIGRIQLVVREIVIKSVIPYAEKQIKSLHEVAANKKSRGLFAGAKRWFGNQKGMAGAIASVGYARDAPELQVRKLADVYFLMNMFKGAYTHYYNAKKDFQQDEAWTYYAPAVEMAALSMFMVNTVGAAEKKYRVDYMEDSVAKYLTVCQSPEFAVRATLFDALCLKNQGMYTESANSYIKMTNELSDLRSAMLLEQAAYCFLQAPLPSLRKYGFHIVLSGYRFTKTGGCKEHAVRLYRQGSQVYDRKGWLLSSENILYTLGHQKFMLKDFSTSAEYFNSLMAVSTGRNHLQQMVHLREFFLVFHARFKENKNVVPITIPKLIDQEVEVSLSDPGVPGSPNQDGDLPVQQTTPSQSPSGNNWQDIEKAILNGIRSQETLVMSQTCQQLFKDGTLNNLSPQAVVGEFIYVTIPFENKFPVGFQMKNLSLLWKFTCSKDDSTYTNEKPDPDNPCLDVKSKPLDVCTLEPNSNGSYVMKIMCYTPGELNIIGVEYMLKPLFPDREPTDHQIRGKQYIQVSGPRLNTVLDHKTKIVYGQDKRLNICVRLPQPLLQARLKTPEVLYSGELKCVELILTNTSKIALKNLHMVCTSPGIFSFGKQRDKTLFELPLIQKPDPPYAIPTVSDPVHDYMDLMPVPLPDQLAGRLGAGTSINLPLWIRGKVGDKNSRDVTNTYTGGFNTYQDQLMQINECLYFYYESGDPSQKQTKFNYRILPLAVSWQLQPSLEVEANFIGETVEKNSILKHLEFSFKNVGKAGTEGYIGDILITQVSLVSKENHFHRLEIPHSINSISPEQTVNMAFKVTNDKPPPDKIIPKKTRKSEQEEAKFMIGKETLEFSSVGLKDNKCHSIQSPPFLDFLKPSFDFGVPKKPPSLKGDTAVIMWRCNSAQPILGQSIIPINYSPAPSQPSSTSIQSSNTTDESLLSLVPSLPYQPVKVQVVHPNQIIHDFTTSPFVCINLTLKFSHVNHRPRVGVENKTGAILLQYRVNTSNIQFDHVMWSGSTQGVKYLAVDQAEPVSVIISLNVKQYGLYNIDCIEYRARYAAPNVDEQSINDLNVENIFNCDEEFSTVDVCFTVLPPSNDSQS